ncbi:hypothetical protein [Actinoallomurus iriomotensis]|uniref:hypothetical protein n=1 Tax=Actinoallomurus iriomotensis TaxID=478107 RepID=UPI0025522389|nr:hypothetical protein [Actinoallomurus iriomotensis]
MNGTQQFTLDDGQYHVLKPYTHYHASWCGIPWYYQGIHFKSMSLDRQNNVQFYTSQVDSANWIYYVDGRTGKILARQGAPKNVDFHCNLRFENDGNYIDIVNDDGSTQDVLAYAYSELKSWVQIAMSGLGALLKSNSGPHTT